MIEASSNTDNRRTSLLGWLLLPLSLFPTVALLTYDSRVYTDEPAVPSTNWIGKLGDGFAHYGYHLFGMAIWIIPALCILAGLCLVAGRITRPVRRILWATAMLCSAACLCQVLGSRTELIASVTAKTNIQCSGGAIGYLMMNKFLAPLLSGFGSSVLMFIILIVSLTATIGLNNIAGIFGAMFRWALAENNKRSENDDDEVDADLERERQLIALSEARAEAKRLREAEKQRIKEEKERAKEEKAREKERIKEEKRAAKAAAQATAATPPPAPMEPLRFDPPSPPPPPPHTHSSATQQGDAVGKGPYILPSLSLLNPLKKSTADHGNVSEMSTRLISTLKLFNIDATLAYTVQGPVVTKYALLLAPGTRYSAVTSISDNLMGALHAKSLRIEAPIPGENHVGIEVPNRSSAGISFREIIESPAWRDFKGELPLLFGKDAAGKELVADLAKMPHMLVAGATGQGKSVCLNAIINGLLMTKTPEQLKFVMVDPKSVEFTSYASIPHLLVPVITDNNKASGVLALAVAEMEKRLKMFARAKVRNIHDFNHRPQLTQTNMFGDDSPVGSDMPRTVPYIVIIIDEVADLMAAAAKVVTPNIARLTAKARAAGIHVILATQRPDAKVITGTIKANIPGRVAFKTATGIDSRTILDEGGAENLIGKGDMLFRTADGMLIRAQGAWISDEEIGRVTQFIEQHSQVEFDPAFNKKLSKIKEASLDDDDEEDEEENQESTDGVTARERVKAEANASDFKKAIECIINTNRASTSHFQRRLGWGYNHAAKIMDMLEEAGVIGPQQGAGPRQITMDRMQLMEQLNGGEASEVNAAEPEADEIFTEDNQ